MKNLWSDKEAKNFVSYYSKSDINEDLSLRVYTSKNKNSTLRNFIIVFFNRHCV